MSAEVLDAIKALDKKINQHALLTDEAMKIFTLQVAADTNDSNKKLIRQTEIMTKIFEERIAAMDDVLVSLRDYLSEHHKPWWRKIF